MIVERVSGTVKKWTIWMKPPKISWIQMHHLYKVSQRESTVEA